MRLFDRNWNPVSKVKGDPARWPISRVGNKKVILRSSAPGQKKEMITDSDTKENYIR